jgi:hypothetical protein
MSDENQTKKEAIVEVITDTKSESSKANESVSSSLKSLTNFFDDLFNKKLPKLPKGFLDFMVQYMPIFNIIGMVWKGIAILTSIAGLLGAISYIVTFSGFSSIFGLLTIIYLISILLAIAGSSIALYFAIKAHSGLETKKTQSWTQLYIGWIVVMIFGILATITSYGNIAEFNGRFGISSGIASSLMIGSILFSIAIALAFDALILYVIFQIRSYYNNK